MMSISVEIVVKKPNSFKRYYEFWLNDKQVAVLEYRKQWGDQAEIRMNDQKWTLKTSGFWKKTIELAAEQSPYTKLQIPFKWSYKMSVSPNNRNTYTILSKGFWRRRWVWEDAQHNEIIESKSNPFSKKNRGAIIIHRPFNDELLLLVVFGWYLVMSFEEVSAVSAV